MARKGINKALQENWQFFEKKRLLSNSEYQKNRTCIFISHKKEDAKDAKELADYIMNSGIDVFFDENNSVLNNPEKNTNPIIVTNEINKALDRSTYIICVISEKTKESWWVPYEIGYVWNNKGFTHNNMAILLIKNIIKLPEYLYLTKNLDSVTRLNSFLKEVSNMRQLLNEDNNLISFNEFLHHPLNNILKP